MGLAVVGGLLFSQTLTLYVTPVFYIVMEKLRGRTRRSKGQTPGRGIAQVPAQPEESPVPATVALRLRDV